MKECVHRVRADDRLEFQITSDIRDLFILIYNVYIIKVYFTWKPDCVFNNCM